MKIVIIEDERLTASDLAQTLLTIDPTIEIVSIVKSIYEGKIYFSKNPVPDLIFSDIRLGDGLSFEILESLQVPVIFCTAYDEYALKAFKMNGIDYILKPFTEKAVRNSLEKLYNIKGENSMDVAKQYKILSSIFKNNSVRSASLLIRHRDMIIPVRYDDIAMVYLDNNVLKAITFDEQIYYPNKSLDELEHAAGESFFRVNRQYLLHREVVSHASNVLSRKLAINVKIQHKESILISREKSTQFLKWLSGEA